MGLLNNLTLFAYKLWNTNLELGKNVKIDARAFIARGGIIKIGDDCVIRAGAMLLPSGGSISIGKNTSINQYTIINGEGNVTIGNKVLIASFVSMYAANHNFEDPNIPIRDQGMTTKGGIKIEDDVWIGTHVVILDGITIGKGSVISAGSIVTQDVEPYSIVAGVPAKIIRYRE